MNPSRIKPVPRLHGLPPQAVDQAAACARALDLGRVADAERHLRPLLDLHANHPEVLRLLAGAQNLRGRHDEAVQTMRRAVALRPGDPLYHNTLGMTLATAQNDDEAIAAFRRACELDPALADSWFNLGLTLKRALRVREADAALRKAIALAPGLANARVMLGDLLKAEGRLDEAAALYRDILARKPASGMAWWGLADLKSRKMSQDDLAAMRKALILPDASDDDVVATGFALAKGLDDHGRYAESLQALADANARARTRRRWNAPIWSRHVDAVLDAFTPPPMAGGGLGEQAIFVVSLPRSGSTLVEQILASHSQVEGAGELLDLPQVLGEESRRRGRPFAEWARVATAEDWRRLGERYLQRTAKWTAQRPRFTDKLPGNWLHIGAIRAMLPGARIVVGRRDRLETCFSCYRQRLTDNEYTRTFEDLAAYWRDFDRAISRFGDLFPARVRVQSYEALVAQPEAQIRQLLDFCGLPFEPACLDFHKSDRPVHTPSATQVREPLRSDTARAARYGALLDPLRAALGLPPFAAAEKA